MDHARLCKGSLQQCSSCVCKDQWGPTLELLRNLLTGPSPPYPLPVRMLSYRISEQAIYLKWWNPLCKKYCFDEALSKMGNHTRGSLCAASTNLTFSVVIHRFNICIRYSCYNHNEILQNCNYHNHQTESHSVFPTQRWFTSRFPSAMNNYQTPSSVGADHCVE